MIQLRSDCLEFEMTSGETIPCSAEELTVELIGQAVEALDPDVVQHAAAAVLHYFKEELGRTHVTADEFASALETVLKGMGFSVEAGDSLDLKNVERADLTRLAFESGKGYELVFFNRLRTEIQRKLNNEPEVMHVTGIRTCVKQLTGSKRWCTKCQKLHDQIVEFLRSTWVSLGHSADCALFVE